MSTPVNAAVSVTDRFLGEVAVKLQPGAAQATRHAARDMARDAGSNHGESVRYCALINRAVREWCAAAVGSDGGGVTRDGLLSLEPVADRESADVVAGSLNDYRRRFETRETDTSAARAVLLATEKAVRIAAEHPERSIPAG